MFCSLSNRIGPAAGSALIQREDIFGLAHNRSLLALKLSAKQKRAHQTKLSALSVALLLCANIFCAYCTPTVEELQAPPTFLVAVHKGARCLLNTLPETGTQNARTEPESSGALHRGAVLYWMQVLHRECSLRPRPRRSWRTGSGSSPPGGSGRWAGGTFCSSRCRCRPAAPCWTPPGRWGSARRPWRSCSVPTV